MFSVQQKRDISEAVQLILRRTGHPELPEGEIEFGLNVRGATAMSWANIRNNGGVESPSVNPFNEAQALRSSGPVGVDGPLPTKPMETKDES